MMQVSLPKLCSIESSAVTASSWGEEVLGVIRVPLYTLPNKLGLPAFLKNQFIGCSRLQLLTGIEKRGLLTSSEVQTALQLVDTDINTHVAHDEIDY